MKKRDKEGEKLILFHNDLIMNN